MKDFETIRKACEAILRKILDIQSIAGGLVGGIAGGVAGETDNVTLANKPGLLAYVTFSNI